MKMLSIEEELKNNSYSVLSSFRPIPETDMFLSYLYKQDIHDDRSCSINFSNLLLTAFSRFLSSTIFPRRASAYVLRSFTLSAVILMF